ncbi:MAG TPA: hypothetical protein VEZ46_16170 [Mycobacteriales bacterium]|jgi:hypothetical protein|nr:hypothetical protein [Mycobacteriales bacterium]
MSDALRAELDELDTEELRSRAFATAEKRHDVRFFWDLAKHLPASGDAATDDGFSGPGTTIADFLELFREMRGRVTPEREPLLRAHFIDYLAEHRTEA